MKQTTLIFIALFISIAVFAQSTPEDDNENGTSLIPILTDAVPVIQEIEAEDLEIVRMEIDILKDRKVTSRVLYSEWSYGIAVVGDYRFEDLDIKVYRQVNGEWELVEQDTGNDKTAIVIVKPTETEEYKIEIIAAKTAEGYAGGHYALLVFHE